MKRFEIGENLTMVLIMLGFFLVIVACSAHCQQASSLSSAPMASTMHPTEHPEHARTVIWPSNPPTIAHGEQPLADVPMPKQPQVSLGEIARQYREGKNPNLPKITVIP